MALSRDPRRVGAALAAIAFGLAAAPPRLRADELPASSRVRDHLRTYVASHPGDARRGHGADVGPGPLRDRREARSSAPRRVDPRAVAPDRRGLPLDGAHPLGRPRAHRHLAPRDLRWARAGRRRGQARGGLGRGHRGFPRAGRLRRPHRLPRVAPERAQAVPGRGDHGPTRAASRLHRGDGARGLAGRARPDRGADGLAARASGRQAPRRALRAARGGLHSRRQFAGRPPGWRTPLRRRRLHRPRDRRPTRRPALRHRIWARCSGNCSASGATARSRQRTGRIFVNEVGGIAEEDNEVRAGSNHGWPAVEHGPTSDGRFAGPVHHYPTASISGAAFAPASLPWPEPYPGRYFFMDFVHGWIKSLDPDRPARADTFAAELRRPVDLRFADDGALLVLVRDAWVIDRELRPWTGALLRIRPSGGSATKMPPDKASGPP